MAAKTSGGGGAVARAAASSADSSSSGGLPAGVKVKNTKDGLYRDYTFRVAGKRIEFTVENRSPDRVSVGFDVDRSLDRGKLKGRDAVRAAQTIKRIFEHDVTTRPDGFKYQASAHTFDGDGARRVAAYKKVGFSAPPMGEPGRIQRGIVKNGKLVPDNSDL